MFLMFLNACGYEGDSLMKWECWASAGQLIQESQGLSLDTCVLDGLVLWGRAGGRLTRDGQVQSLD